MCAYCTVWLQFEWIWDPALDGYGIVTGSVINPTHDFPIDSFALSTVPSFGRNYSSKELNAEAIQFDASICWRPEKIPCDVISGVGTRGAG